jgi:hypothetical protein
MLSFFQFFTFQRQVILFAVCTVLTVLLWTTVGFSWAWIPLLFVIILLSKHILIGTVNGAAMKMQTGDIVGAEKLLKYTLNPSWLQFGYHGMYYFMLSSIAMQKGENKKAEALTNKVLGMKIADDFKGMGYLQLINLSALQLQRDPKNQIVINRIKELHQKAKKLNITTPQVKEQLNQVEMMLKGGDPEMQKKMAGTGKGGMKAMMQQGFMRRNPGKKR